MQEVTDNCSPTSAERLDKRLRVALPLRITYWDENDKPGSAMACTYDISARGARITGFPQVKEPGEIIAVERGRNRIFCRVIWVANSNSSHPGQIGIQAVETERLMWEAEIRELDDVYDPVLRGWTMWGTSALSGNDDRRSHSRFPVEGLARLTNQGPNPNPIHGQLRDLSELGCLVTSERTLLRGAELKLTLNVGKYDFSVKGLVRHVGPDSAAGIQFREIRKGDRDRLQHLLQQMAEKEFEDSFELVHDGRTDRAASVASR
jgi:PilZ domain